MAEEIELYLHIPFCVKKCEYCDFLSAPAADEMIQRYVDTLVKEIREYGDQEIPNPVRSIFLGGGTPSLLSANQIEAIFSALRESFFILPGAEITLEANPGTVTEEKGLKWREVGINRLSIGLQSANDEELRVLGRIHDYHEFKDTYELVRRLGFSNINVDLIFGIPGQTLESWKQTLRRVTGLFPEPEHLSAYSLIIEEGTPFYARYGPEAEPLKGYPPLPDEETERRMDEETERILSDAGYERYEISNFAKSGYACQHNLGYWRRIPYLGMGLGASSFMGQKRYRNPDELGVYMRKIQQHEPRQEETEILKVQDQMAEFMYLGLRITKGVQKSEFLRQFGVTLDSVYGETIQEMRGNQLLTVEGDWVRLTKRGRDISNYVLADFLP